jgi:hypothetical protein
MDWAALFKIFQSWGPSAISSALVVVVIHLIRLVNKNSEKEDGRAAAFQKQLDAKVEKVREDIGKTLGDHGRRIAYIETEYVRRDTFYRELSGWKEDINRLSDKIDALGADFAARVIEVWKGRSG